MRLDFRSLPPSPVRAASAFTLDPKDFSRNVDDGRDYNLQPVDEAMVFSVATHRSDGGDGFSGLDRGGFRCDGGKGSKDMETI